MDIETTAQDQPRKAYYPCLLLVLGYKPLAMLIGEADVQHARLYPGASEHIYLNQNPDYSVSSGDVCALLVPSSESEKIRLPAHIVELHSDHITLQFDTQHLSAVRTLLALIDGNNDQPLNAGRRESLLADIMSQWRHRLPDLLGRFIQNGERALFDEAQKARSNEQQAQLLDARTALLAEQKKLQARLLGLYRFFATSVVLQNLEEEQALALVDQADYERRLGVFLVSEQVLQGLPETFYALLARSNHLAGLSLDPLLHPFSPQVMTKHCWLFLHALSLPDSVSVLLMPVWREMLQEWLQDVIPYLNDILLKANILPGFSLRQMKDLSTVAPPSLGGAGKHQGEAACAPLHQTSPSNKPFQSDQLSSSGQRSPSGQQALPHQLPLQPSYQQLPLDVSQTQALYSTVRSLIFLNQSELESTEKFGAVDVSRCLRAIASDALSENRLQAGVPVLRLIKESLLRTDPQKSIDIDIVARLELLESVFQALQSDPLIHEQIKLILRRFEIPLTQVLLEDENMLGDKQHPARELLNQLAVLSHCSDIAPALLEQRLGDSLQLLSGEVLTRADCQLVLDDVNRLLDSQQQAHLRNADRVVKTYEGQERLILAHKETKKALSRRLLSAPVPKIVLSLLECGWRDLLVRSYLRGDGDNPQWREYLAVVDQLLVWLDDGHSGVEGRVSRGVEADTFIDLIDRELDAGFPGQYAHVMVIKELRHLLNSPDMQAQQIARIQIAGDDWYGLVMDEPPRTIKTEAREQLARWLDRARQLVVGDWLGAIGPEGQDDMRLVWVSHDRERFVFVNHLGQKTADLTLLQLAEKMQQGWQRLDQPEWNYVDQGLYTFLQKVYDELDFQRSHDQLTGLLNRKEFERLLEYKMPIWRQSKERHILIKLDLDQFSVINKLYGTAGGDRYLCELSTVLKQSLPVAVDISRFGSNEFVILIEHCTPEQGKVESEKLRAEVQAFRFEWQNSHYGLTASLGLIVIELKDDDVGRLLSDLDAACQVAKEEGGNRCYLFEDQDSQLQKQDDVLSWVTHINRALDEDRLTLRCQRIQPIDASRGLKMHYEILLGVLSEDGSVLIPPDKFIAAAERFNRMQDVDRWVVNNVLNWIERWPEKLAQMEALSVNLSGHTLNDDLFLVFLLERLQQVSAPLHLLCFEVTETATIANISKAIDFIKQIKALGCEFALDDFGTGLSSYEYLKRLPVDYLKIDGCFVKDLASSKADYAVVKSIHEIGHFMGKKTIAEYVEDDEILAILAEIGVDYAQGYGIEKPMLLDDIQVCR
jgi:diguanylate cyclase (GGDEF)-like protein